MRLLLVAMAVMALAASALAQDDTPTAIEFGRTYSFEGGAEAAYFTRRAYVGLEQARGVRATVSIVRQEKHRRWVPGVTLMIGPARMLTDDAVAPTMNLAIAGLGSMDIRAYTWSAKKRANQRTFKRKLRRDQKVRLEISWATPGRIQIQVDGQETHSVPLTGAIEALSFSLSTGRFKVEDLVFERK